MASSSVAPRGRSHDASRSGVAPGSGAAATLSVVFVLPAEGDIDPVDASTASADCLPAAVADVAVLAACARSAAANSRSASPAVLMRHTVPRGLAGRHYLMIFCSASSALLAVDFTVPRDTPAASAISASESPP
jgi:hypothetical protein